ERVPRQVRPRPPRRSASSRPSRGTPPSRLLRESLQDVTVRLHPLTESLLEGRVGTTRLDVLRDGIADGLRHRHAIDTCDELQLVGLLSGLADRCDLALHHGQLLLGDYSER